MRTAPLTATRCRALQNRYVFGAFISLHSFSQRKKCSKELCIARNWIRIGRTSEVHLSFQLATLELKEMNEKQRADHADSQLKLLQNQNHQIEQRNEELETKFSDVTRANMELQRTERDLRDQLVTSIPKKDYEDLNSRIQVKTLTRWLWISF